MAEAPDNNDKSDFLDVEDRFAIVPEWLLDAQISDCAVRLYAVLLRYGHSSGARMPSRATLARRLHKKSTDTVDRAMRDLVDLGAVQVQARFAGRERLTNLYRVRTSRPPQAQPGAAANVSPPPPPTPILATATATVDGSRKSAAGPADALTSGRTNAVSPAAPVRHNPESSTESKTPPSIDAHAMPSVAVDCGIADWPAFVDACLDRRKAKGQPLARWSARCLDAALQLAVRTRSWPAASAAQALMEVAADPASQSPMRLAEAGPWWDATEMAVPKPTSEEEAELRIAEAQLAEIGGLRVTLQRRARAELEREGKLLTRTSVCLRAYALLKQSPDRGTE